MILSAELMKYQDGIVFHAAAFDGVVNAAVDAARCSAHRRRLVWRGKSEPKELMKTFSLR